MKERILTLLKSYMAIATDTGTSLEKNAEHFFTRWFEEIPEADDCGLYDIEGDSLGRKIAYAFQKGATKNTVVLMHHYDTVNTETYGIGKVWAGSPEKLQVFFQKEGWNLLGDDARADLESGEWMFGRGAADMKGGGALHMAVFESLLSGDKKPNVLLVAVPDEENLSQGARELPFLLQKLQTKYDLHYGLMIDAEPHERKRAAELVVHRGSVGKVLFTFVVKGKLSHVSEYFAGVNPLKILAALVSSTEGNVDFVEEDGDFTYPPAWLRLRDTKEQYDVSLPEMAEGALSVFLLQRSPEDVAMRLKKLFQTAMDHTISENNVAAKAYADRKGEPTFLKQTSGKVFYFSELWKRLSADQKKEIESGVSRDLSSLDQTLQKMQEVLRMKSENEPAGVIGIAPPYNPPVSNRPGFLPQLEAVCRGKFGLSLQVAPYFMGISDLSFARCPQKEDGDFVTGNMPLSFRLPMDVIREISMPVINLGPWGKELHQVGERVWIKDLTEVIPYLTLFVIKEFVEK